MATIKITISTEKAESVNTQKTLSVNTEKAESVNTPKTVSTPIKETKDNQEDVVDKISSLLNIERGKSDNERCSTQNC